MFLAIYLVNFFLLPIGCLQRPTASSSACSIKGFSKYANAPSFFALSCPCAPFNYLMTKFVFWIGVTQFLPDKVQKNKANECLAALLDNEPEIRPITP
jgi:hypothetical protein